VFSACRKACGSVQRGFPRPAETFPVWAACLDRFLYFFTRKSTKSVQHYFSLARIYFGFLPFFSRFFLSFLESIISREVKLQRRLFALPFTWPIFFFAPTVPAFFFLFVHSFRLRCFFPIAARTRSFCDVFLVHIGLGFFYPSFVSYFSFDFSPHRRQRFQRALFFPFFFILL